MVSKNCSSRLTSIWNKGISERPNGQRGKMNNTLIRKSATTHIRIHYEKKEDVADKLQHKVSTQEKYYNVVRKGENAVKTSLFLAKVFKGQNSHSKWPLQYKMKV